MVSRDKSAGDNKPVTRPQPERASGRKRKPVTIDLEPKAVRDKTATNAAKPAAKATVKPTVAAKAQDKSTMAKPTTAKTAESTATKATPKPTTAATAQIKPTPDKPGGQVDAAARSAVGPKKVDKSTAKSPADTRKHETVSPPPTSQGGNGLAFAGAGIVGGVIALLGAYGLHLAGMIPVTGDNRSAALQTEVGDLKTQLEAMSAKVIAPPDLAPVQERLEQISGQFEKQQQGFTAIQQAQGASGKEISALGASIKSLQTKTAGLEQSINAGEAGENPALAALGDRLTKIEQSSDAADSAKELTAKLGELENSLAALASSVPSSQALASQVLAEIGTSITGVSDRVGDLESRITASAKATEDQLAALEKGQGNSAAEISAMGEQLSAFDEKLASPDEEESRVAQVVALTSLKSAIDNGGGFGEALALASSLGDDPQGYASLEPFAEKGIPTVSMLETSFSALAQDVIAATAPKDDGMMGKLFSNARSLVKVKAIGGGEGDGVEAIVSRLEARLKKGDLASAIGEWDALPKVAKNVSAGWHSAATARLTANKLIDDLLNKFVAGLSGAGN